jgi:hypothetical protein
VLFRFEAPLWLHTAEGGWHFVTLPSGVSDEIEEHAADSRRGFGSVPVQVTIGGTTWRTSIFPDTKAGAYVLPVKKAVRQAERISAGDVVEVTVEPQVSDGS